MSSTSSPRRSLSERALASAGTDSENAASLVTMCLSPLEVALPIGPSLLTAPNLRVCRTPPPASSCSNVSGPEPSSAEASPGSSYAGPTFASPDCETEPLTDSRSPEARALDHTRGQLRGEVVPRLLGHPAPGGAADVRAGGVVLHDVERRGGDVAALGDPVARRGLVVEVHVVRARRLGPAVVVRELVRDDPAARVLALDDRGVHAAVVRRDADGLGEAVDQLAREPARSGRRRRPCRRPPR